MNEDFCERIDELMEEMPESKMKELLLLMLALLAQKQDIEEGKN